MILMRGKRGTLSPLAKVRVRVSSITVFRFSTHTGSTGPSSTNHFQF